MYSGDYFKYWLDPKRMNTDNESVSVGNFNDLVTINKNTYAGLFEYYKTNPVEWIEMMTGIKLLWYQKVMIKSIFNKKSHR